MDFSEISSIAGMNSFHMRCFNPSALDNRYIVSASF